MSITPEVIDRLPLEVLGRAWSGLSAEQRKALPDDVRGAWIDRMPALLLQQVSTPAAPKVPAVAALDWHALAARGDPPPREWLEPEWLPRGHPALLASGGGIGKSTLMQQWCSAAAIRAEFISAEASFSSLMWNCEDDESELWRKQARIAAHYGVPLDAFAERFFIVPRVGHENAIATTEYGRLMYSLRLEELREQAHDLRVDVVVLDNVRHLFLIEENNNSAITQCINAVVGALRGITVIFVGHIARSTGSEYSNGAAWENACRTRLYLGERLPDEPEDRDQPADLTARVLARRKANYAAKDLRRFTFRNGVFVPDEPEVGGGMVGHLRTARIQRTLLTAAKRLAEMGVRFTDATNSPQYLPRLVLNYKLGEGATKRELADALRNAMLDGQMVKGEVGKYENRTPMFGLKVAP